MPSEAINEYETICPHVLRPGPKGKLSDVELLQRSEEFNRRFSSWGKACSTFIDGYGEHPNPEHDDIQFTNPTSLILQIKEENGVHSENGSDNSEASQDPTKTLSSRVWSSDRFDHSCVWTSPKKKVSRWWHPYSPNLAVGNPRFPWILKCMLRMNPLIWLLPFMAN